MSAYQGIKDRLGDRVVSERGQQVEARCPAHEDQSPSLGLSVRRSGDPGAVVHCQAGCSATEVMQALDLDLAALFDRHWDHTNGNGRREIEAYPYPDADGQLLYEVVRFEPKKFVQRRPDGNGGFIWKLDGVARVIYRLPDVLEAVKAGRTVFVVEGERDVHALEAEGEVATCNPGGAKKWRPEYGAWLHGADVIVVADRDEPGREHAETVRASLEGVAASVRVVEPVEGKDATDHLASGHGVDDFALAAAEPAPCARRSELVSFDHIKSKPIRWLWEDRIALGKITGVAGAPKTGKGLLHAHLVARVTRGELGGDLEGPRNVIVLTTEDDPGDTLKPRLQAAGADMSRVFMLRMGTASEPVPFRVPQDADELAWHVAKADAALVVVDPLMEFIDGKTDTHKSGPVRQAVSSLNVIAGESGCAVLAVLHLNKGTSSDPLLRHEGSAAFTQILRGAMMLGADPESEDKDRRVLAPSSSNLSRLAASLTLKIVGKIVVGDTGEPIATAKIEFTGESSASASDLLRERHGADDGERTAAQEAEDFLRDELADGPVAAREGMSSARACGIAPRTLKRAKAALGVEVTKTGFRGGWEWSVPRGPSTDGPLGDDPLGPLGENPVDTGDSGSAPPEGGHRHERDPLREGEGVKPLFGDEEEAPGDPPASAFVDEAERRYGERS